MSLVTPRLSTTSDNTVSSLPGLMATRSQSNSKPRLSRQLQQPHVTLIEYKAARFLITDQPNNSHMQNFIVACRLHQVHLLVRVCEPTYDENLLVEAGIKVVSMEFDDGAPPPDSVVEAWFEVISDLLQRHPGGCVAVHCKAGLGRAPALVAIALIELGLPYDEAVAMIRRLRPGALNIRQIEYLKQFRPRKRLRPKSSTTDKCFIL